MLRTVELPLYRASIAAAPGARATRARERWAVAGVGSSEAVGVGEGVALEGVLDGVVLGVAGVLGEGGAGVVLGAVVDAGASVGVGEADGLADGLVVVGIEPTPPPTGVAWAAPAPPTVANSVAIVTSTPAAVRRRVEVRRLVMEFPSCARRDPGRSIPARFVWPHTNAKGAPGPHAQTPDCHIDVKM